MLEEIDGLPPVDFATLPPALERAGSEQRLSALKGDIEPVTHVDDLTFPSDGVDIPVRLYRPAGATGTVLFIHGGGWVVGSLDTHDNSCRILANTAKCNVVSVGYRKAPEHRFPAGLNDTRAGLDWLLREASALGLDTTKLVICGESAGGNLAAILAIHARDKGIPLAGQALIYPVIDTSMGSDSYRLFANGFYLSAGAMDWFIGHYAAEGDRAHPDIVPLHAESLANLAPAFIATADHDPLRDEGRAYAAALINAGVDTSFVEIQGVVHGLWVMNGVTPASRALIERTASWIRSRLG